MNIKNNKNIDNVFLPAILAGIFIGLAGFGYLVNSTIGMFMFIFGLCAIVNYKVPLFTGNAGFVNNSDDVKNLILTLFGNIIGCILISLIVRCSIFPIQDAALVLLSTRLAINPIKCGILAIGCGILMTSSVTFARKSNNIGHWLPLLFAVPLFILCGFPHCIADAFYYSCVPLWFTFANISEILVLYVSIVIGNFIGCNVYRIFLKQNQ